MPNSQVGPIRSSFVDKRRGFSETTRKVTGDYSSLTTMRTALKAADANAYSDANLDRMTMNDVVYAYRILVDSAGIK